MTEKLNVLLTLKDRLSGGLNKIKTKFKGFGGQVEKFRLKNMALFDAIEDRVPGVGNMLKMLSNPYVLVTAAVVGLGVATVKLTQHLMDASTAMRENQHLASQLFNVTGSEMEQIAIRGTAINKTLGADYKDTLVSANTLAKEFGISNNQAFDIIEKGFFSGANASGDFLNQLKEYPAQLKEVGLSADQAVALMSRQVKTGVWSDKGVDAIKEAKLSLNEMTKATSDALKGIGLGEDFRKQIKDGEITAFQAIQKVSGAMAMADVKARQTAIADIFKGAGEDAGMRYLLSLKDINLNLDEMVNKGDPVVKHQMQMLKLQKELAAETTKFAPGFASLADSFEFVKIKGQILFYKVINFFRNAYNQSAIFRFALGSITSTFKFLGAVVSITWNIIKGLFEGIYNQINSIYTRLGGEGNIFKKMWQGAEGIALKVEASFNRFVDLAKVAGNVIGRALAFDVSGTKAAFDEFKTLALNFNKNVQDDVKQKLLTNKLKKENTSAEENLIQETTAEGNGNPTPTATAASTAVTATGSTGGNKSISITINSLVGELQVYANDLTEGAEEIEKKLTKALLGSVRQTEMLG